MNDFIIDEVVGPVKMPRRLEFTKTPTVKWRWNVFGSTPSFVIELPHEVSWLARIVCSLLLRSKWERGE